MYEERRNHDPRPDEQERTWMQTNPLHLAARVLVLVALSVSIGTAASLLAGPQTQSGAVVAKAR